MKALLRRLRLFFRLSELEYNVERLVSETNFLNEVRLKQQEAIDEAKKRLDVVIARLNTYQPCDFCGEVLFTKARAVRPVVYKGGDRGYVCGNCYSSRRHSFEKKESADEKS